MFIGNIEMVGAIVSLALFLLEFSAFTRSQEIVDFPKSLTVFEGSTGARFTCETNGSLSGWNVNGTSIAHLPLNIRINLNFTLNVTNRGYNLLTLTFPSMLEYNESVVQCHTMRAGRVQESKNATLLIQGKLLSVGSFNYTNNNSTITLLWTAPFSLDVTNVDPDIWYSVLIYNITDEKKLSIIHCDNCTNITETSYTFVPYHLVPAANVLIIFVVPYNGAGPGERSPNITIVLIRVDENTGESKTTDDAEVAAISISTVIVLVAMVCGLIALSLLLYKHFYKNKISESDPAAYVEYEEIDLPIIMSSSFIETEPNYAYIVKVPRPINSVKNIAYGMSDKL